MKKGLEHLLDEASTKELDTLLENTALSEALDDKTLMRIQTRTIEKIGLSHPSKKKSVKKRVLLLAAALILLMIAVLGTVVFAAEQKEYRNAVAFFEEYSLEREGLTRSEIKAVYRDIETQRFSYSKTAEVIEKSLSKQQVGGFEIFQSDPSPEEIKAVWEKNVLMRYPCEEDGDWRYIVKADDGVRFGVRCEYMQDEYSNSVSIGDRIERYDQEGIHWSLFLESSAVVRMYAFNDGLLAECSYRKNMAEGLTRTCYRLVQINNRGEIVWEYELNRESSVGCFDNSDGTVSVLTQSYQDKKHYLNVRVLDQNGNMLKNDQNEIEGSVIKASCFENGYILVVSNKTDTEKTKICLVDFTGKAMNSFVHLNATQSYCILDVIEYGGNIYISANAIPKYDDYELASVLDFVFLFPENDRENIPSEELTKKLREYYTATLFVCNPGDGTLEELYLQKGAFAGTLSVQASGKLEWETQSLVSAKYSPYTSSFSFSGQCYVYRYCFDANGTILGQEKTDKVVYYAK